MIASGDRARRNGYTLMQGYVATHGTTPAKRRVPYDAIKDSTPIGMIGGTPNVLVVNFALPVKSLAEFTDYVKKNPARVSYGSARQGSLPHLTMELFKQRIGAFVQHISYRGFAPAFTDMLGGQTQAMFPALPRHCRSCARDGHERSPGISLGTVMRDLAGGSGTPDLGVLFRDHAKRARPGQEGLAPGTPRRARHIVGSISCSPA